MPGRERGVQSDLQCLDGTSQWPAGRGLRLDGFGCEATVVGHLQKPGSGEVHGRERSLLQAHTLKPSKFPKLSVHASALDVPKAMRP